MFVLLWTYLFLLLQKRLRDNEALALEFTATELFEAASVAKGQEWADMTDSAKQQYAKLAEGKLTCSFWLLTCARCMHCTS